MKHLIFTDLHVGLNINNEVWEKLPIKAIEHLTTTARRRNIESIIFLGDFYDNRKELNIKAIDSARVICEMLNEFNTKIIIGNHDSYFKNNIELTSLQTIDKFQNIEIISKPTVVYDKIGLCPWSCNFRELKTPILMGHFDIKDFKMNDNTLSLKGEPSSSFKDFKIVISGHYHTYSKKDNIIYIGNMYGHTFNDINATRGYWIFDDETLDMEFIEFEEAPKFIYIFNKDYEGLSIKGNIIKVFFTEELSEKDVIDYLTKLNSMEPLELNTDFSKIKIDNVQMNLDEDIDIGSLDERKLFHDYIEKISLPEHIKPTLCKKIIDELFLND